MRAPVEEEEMLERSFPPRSASSDPDVPRLTDRVFWLCMPIGIIAAIVILLSFGLSWWSAVAIAFLIACPAVVIWVLVVERGLPGACGRKR
jgi:hypothetical protein